MHGPPEREDGPALSAALAVGEGVEGRSGVEEEEGDEKCVSIFGVVVAGSAVAVAAAPSPHPGPLLLHRGEDDRERAEAYVARTS